MPRGIYDRESALQIAERERRELNNAAKGAMGSWVAEMRPWDVFFTGTYDRKRLSGSRGAENGGSYLAGKSLPRVSRRKALHDGRQLMAFARRLRGHRCEGVLAAEPHGDGSYHIHGLLEAPGVTEAELEAMRWYWIEHHGRCDFDRPRSREDVSSYTGKYLCKSSGDVYLTRGLRRPQLREVEDVGVVFGGTAAPAADV